MQLEDIVKEITSSDSKVMEETKERWNKIAKPLGSLGLLEEAVIKIAGIKGNSLYSIDKKCIVVMCADNGVVEEGVTQTDSSVTAVVAGNFTKGNTSVNIMGQVAGADIIPVDIGMNTDVDHMIRRKISYGTKNMAKEPAMTEEEARACIQIGIDLVLELKNKGYEMIGTGEMGIGNTTTSSAIASVLLDESVEKVTGKGAGLSTEGLDRKIKAIKQAILTNKPDKHDPLDVLTKVGGFDIAGLTGLFLGGAYYGVPIVIDGFISAISALLAVRLCDKVRDYILPSHTSKEPAGQMVMEALGLSPFIRCEMYLGEGTGVAAVYPILDMALQVYTKMSTFQEIEIEEYKTLN